MADLNFAVHIMDSSRLKHLFNSENTHIFSYFSTQKINIVGTHQKHPSEIFLMSTIYDAQHTESALK